MAILDKDTFSFLRALAANNSKDWMDAHRQRYQKNRKGVIALTEALYQSFATVAVMPIVDPKKSVARINRNRRFHPNKPPYKENFGIMIKRSEAKVDFYINLEPDNCFVGTGLYHPPREALNAVRDRIDFHGDELKTILAQASLKKAFGELQGAELKTSPRDFPADHPHIDLLRKTDLILMHQLSETDFFEDDIVARLTELFSAALPFMDFLDAALAE
jgi:uncharacterized protein (TIGR02453 family)